MNKYWKKEMRRLREAQYNGIQISDEKKYRLKDEKHRLVIEHIRCSSDAYVVYAAMDAAYDSAKPTGWHPGMGYGSLLKDPKVQFWSRQYRRIKKRDKKLIARINRCSRLMGNPVMNRQMKIIHEVFTSSP